ncbi:hypothetical protein [Pseudonocardia sp.]|uniref:hypothetical protein n=1 Tax=Pseudonocardia sp. TaxID=60912 RepID=UPI003D096C67
MTTQVTPLLVRPSSDWMFGAAIATIVWSMNVIATANIIAVSASHFDRAASLPGPADPAVTDCSAMPLSDRHR